LSTAAHRLRLTESAPAAWDDRLFRQALRDSGLIATLKPATLRVLFMAYAMSDAKGEVDLPRRWLAEALQLTRRAVRDAVHGLESAELAHCIGRSPVAPNVYRYRLVVPGCRSAADQAKPEASDRQDAAPSDRPAASGVSFAPAERPTQDAAPRGEHTFRGGSCVPRGGKLCSAGGEAVFPQRPLKDLGKSSRRQSARAEESVEGSLFERPTYDAAAAAALRAAGFSAREAHGLVHRYRPTVRHVRNIVANAACWRWEHRRGRRRDALRSVSNFIRGSLREGRTALDDQVLDVRRMARKRAEAARKRRRAGPSPRTPAPAADEDARYRAAFDALSADQVAAVRDELTAEMPPQLASLLADKRSGGPSWIGAIVDRARDKGLLAAAEGRDAMME